MFNSLQTKDSSRRYGASLPFSGTRAIETGVGVGGGQESGTKYWGPWSGGGLGWCLGQLYHWGGRKQDGGICPLPDEGGVAPLLAGCLGEWSRAGCLLGCSALPHPSRTRRGGGDAGGWCPARPGRWGRGPCPLSLCPPTRVEWVMVEEAGGGGGRNNFFLGHARALGSPEWHKNVDLWHRSCWFLTCFLDTDQ